MKTLTTVKEIRAALAQERSSGHSISFVPTMGNLHDGHMALVRAGRKVTDCVVVSIFVNPMQFGQNEDLDAYPRTLEQDQEKLILEGVKYLFAPTAREMYPHGANTRIIVPGLSDILCGASRPGHFSGVATICSKLFNIVQPDIAVFGEKDYQQLTIIRHMVDDLCIPVRIVGVETGRAQDGLALSSRNQYLSENERSVSSVLYAALVEARDKLLAGERNYHEMEQAAIEKLQAAGLRPDYFHIMSRDRLEAPTPVDGALVILAAAQLGKARLIDNVQLDL